MDKKKIIKIAVLVLAALALLGTGFAIGRCTGHGDRGGRFDRFDRSGFMQEGSGCGAQDNFRDGARRQRAGQEANIDQPADNQAGQAGQADQSGSQVINRPTNKIEANQASERGSMRGGDPVVDAQMNGQAATSTKTK